MAQESPIPRTCEVIVLTALPVEYQAVLHYLQKLQEVVHPSGTIYHQGTFAGTHRTWRVAVAEIGMGGVSAAIEAEKAINFFHARIALFVGVAGGLKDVRLGDVVVATKIYAYESGKAARRLEPRPDLGHPSHALEQRARAEAHHDEWLARLDGSCPDPAPQVFIGALAAGEKVLASRRSSLARLLQTTYGDALAIEMEGHGFLHAIRVNHAVHGLVIRGISDLIDDKPAADAAGWQEVAARHAAAFAFQVLAKFDLPEQEGGDRPMSGPGGTGKYRIENHQMVPGQVIGDGNTIYQYFGAPHAAFPGYTASSPSSEPVWNVPYPRNPFFTGREDLLEQLHTQLQTAQTAAVSQPQAISGLGGIGKTQLVIEYAHRYGQEYQAVLWAQADTTEALNTSYTEIASVLKLLQKDTQEQEFIVQAVKDWLNNKPGWLLILDNADELDIVQPFLPTRFAGHLLLTTRAQWMGELAQPLKIETMDEEAGALLLLRRARLVAPDALLEDATLDDRALAKKMTEELGGLPLALDQAGAYIEETGCGLAEYDRQYQTERAQLLARRGGKMKLHHPEPVATTWSISFAKVEAANPTAAELLRICAFLAPDAIPEELLVEALRTPLPASTRKGKQRGRGSWFSPLTGGQLDEAVATLRAYSLIQRNPQEKTLSVHRLVQAVIRETIEQQEQVTWITRVVSAVNALFPAIGFDTWKQCERYLPQALVCDGWIAQKQLNVLEGASLLDRVGRYFYWRILYTQAEPLFERALAIREQELGARHPDTASSLNNLAMLYYRQEEYTQAEPLFERALAIREQELGARHPDTASSLNNLALLYQEQEKYAQAEPLLERALAIVEQELGAAHPDTALSLNNLAMFYYRQEKYAQAEPLLERALAIVEQEAGSPPLTTWIIRENFTALLEAMNGE